MGTWTSGPRGWWESHKGDEQGKPWLAARLRRPSLSSRRVPRGIRWNEEVCNAQKVGPGVREYRRPRRGVLSPVIVACTIVARNYLAQAQVLVDSFRDHHPDGSFHVLVIDDP